jgi:hypothetical protein
MRAGALLLTLVGAVGVARGQAEPAPAGYVPPGWTHPVGPPPPPVERRWASQPKWHLGVAPRLDFMLGNTPDGVPLIGFGGSVAIDRAVAPIGVMRFGVGMAFAYDKWQHDRTTTGTEGGTVHLGTQSIGEASFIARALVDGLFGRVRPWLALGGGLSVAHYNQPPGANGMIAGVVDDSVLPLVHGALGFGVDVYRGFDIGLHGECNGTFLSPTKDNHDLYGSGFCLLSLDLGFRT